MNAVGLLAPASLLVQEGKVHATPAVACGTVSKEGGGAKVVRGDRRRPALPRK